MSKQQAAKPVTKGQMADRVSFSVSLILDFENPTLGFVTVDGFDQADIELRQSMN